MSAFTYLIRFFRHQIGLKVISVLIGITMWMMVLGSRTIEISKDVPFEVLMNENQILIDPVPEKITFRISGPKAFIRTLTNRLEDPIQANVKNLSTGVFTQRIYSESLKLPVGVKVQSINPSVVQVKIEELKKKNIGVKLETMGQPPVGYKISRMEVLPAQFRIRGPKNRLNSLSVFSTIPVDLSGVTETTVIPLGFDFRAIGIEPDAPLPELHVEVQAKGQAYRIRHVPLKVRSSAKTSLIEDEVTVIVRTDLNDPVKIEGEQVAATIDVRDYPQGEYVKWIHIQLPPRVHLVRVIPAMAKVKVMVP